MSVADVLDFNDTAPKTSPLTIALRYAGEGKPVFPCNPINKRPITEHGFKDATTDAFKIRNWWKQFPNAMIGMPTGEASGVWVLDIDTDATKGKDGIATLAGMGRDLPELLDTVVGRTATGGYHCYFRFDTKAPVGSWQKRPGKDCDTRGAGGYVILPGSRLADGRAYEWLNPPEENEYADAPDWLLQAIISAAPGGDPFDFNDAAKTTTPAVRVAQAVAGTWHENTRDLVARMVREGASDETIAAIAPRFTEVGYDHQQTIAEFLTHARTARAKWGYQPKEIVRAGPQPADGLKFLDVDELEQLEPVSWLVDAALPIGGFIALYGPSGGLKSFVAIDIALHIATGREWQGRTVQQGRVVYVAGEGKRGMAKRVMGWRRAKPDVGRPDFHLLAHAISVGSPDSVAQLAAAIAVLPSPPALIVLDTLARNFGPGDENSQKDMGAFVRGVDKLTELTGAAIMVVHHTGKDDAKGERGSSAFRGALDTSILVRRKGRRIELVNQAPFGKQKDADEFEDIKLYAAPISFEHQGVQEKTLVLMKDDDTLVGQSHCEDDREADQSQRLGTIEASILTALEQAARSDQTLGFARIRAVVGQLTKKDINGGSLARSLRSLEAKALIQKVELDGREGYLCLPQ